MVGDVEPEEVDNRRGDAPLRYGARVQITFDARTGKNQRHPGFALVNLAEAFRFRRLRAVRVRMVAHQNEQRTVCARPALHLVHDNPEGAIHVGFGTQVGRLRIGRAFAHVGRQVERDMHTAAHPVEEQRPIFIAFVVHFHKAAGKRNIVVVFRLEFVVVEPFFLPHEFVVKLRIGTAKQLAFVTGRLQHVANRTHARVGIVVQERRARVARHAHHDAEKTFDGGVTHAMRVRVVGTA